MIESTLKKVKHKCSLIMVGVMSHGCRGCLLGSHGDAIPINDIVQLFHTQLPDEVPLVSVCQEKCLQLPFHHITMGHWFQYLRLDCICLTLHNRSPVFRSISLKDFKDYTQTPENRRSLVRTCSKNNNRCSLKIHWYLLGPRYVIYDSINSCPHMQLWHTRCAWIFWLHLILLTDQVLPNDNVI